jgi:hypothetical protein
MVPKVRPTVFGASVSGCALSTKRRWTSPPFGVARDVHEVPAAHTMGHQGRSQSSSAAAVSFPSGAVSAS